jgi:diaminopimelate epimerase
MTSLGRVIHYVKASACGNDFLIIDGAHATEDLAGFSRRICDRHEGVGADGVEWLFPADEADVQARLFNADGSEAEISGNGTRCVAAHINSEQAKEKVVILTGAGLKVCNFISRNRAQFEFDTDMGEPEVGDELSIEVNGRRVNGIPVSMGNPHYVIFVSKFVSGWQAEAAEIGRRHNFKQGINVELVNIKNEGNIDVVFFERGVGETQSSGTGSCAAAVAAIVTGKAKSPVRVHTAGGMQTVRWEQQVYLRGTARIVCRGEFFL